MINLNYLVKVKFNTFSIFGLAAFLNFSTFNTSIWKQKFARNSCNICNRNISHNFLFYNSSRKFRKLKTTANAEYHIIYRWLGNNWWSFKRWQGGQKEAFFVIECDSWYAAFKRWWRRKNVKVRMNDSISAPLDCALLVISRETMTTMTKKIAYFGPLYYLPIFPHSFRSFCI